MAEERRTNNLLIELMKRSHLPWHWATALFATVLILFFIFMVYLDGFINRLSAWSFWRNFLDSPVMITYILVVFPFMWRLWQGAIQAFRPLLAMEEGDFNRLAAEISAPNRLWEWVAVLVGAVFWLSMEQPWNWRVGTEALWLYVHEAVMGPLLFGLLGWLIYSSVNGARRFTRLSRRQLNLDVFHPEQLAPAARWSLGISLAFIGGISLSLVFQAQESLLRWNNIITYAVLVCATVLIFFLSMWSTHTAMAGAKTLKLGLARKYLAGVSRELEDRTAEGRLEGIEGLSSTIVAWVNYERRVKEAPTWPFDAVIIRRLAASVLVPAAVYLIRVFSGLGLRL